jgi:broad specificity phosphatase PhoE
LVKPQRAVVRWCALALLCGLEVTAVGADRALAQAAPLEVFFVRHAERAAAPNDDPPLTDAGHRRAAELVTILRAAGITAIFTSTYLRTQQTAAPLATALGISAQQIGFARGIPAHIVEIANAVRNHRGGTALVVGHSNTVPAIIGRLGGPKLQDLCETTFDLLFTVELQDGGPKLTQRRYGEASPPATPGCL